MQRPVGPHSPHWPSQWREATQSRLHVLFVALEEEEEEAMAWATREAAAAGFPDRVATWASEAIIFCANEAVLPDATL